MKLETVRIPNGYRLAPVQAAAQPPGVPPAILALCKLHGLNIPDRIAAGPRPFDVTVIDQHFAMQGTDLEARFAVKSALRQIGLL